MLIHLHLQDDSEVSHTLDEINAKLRSGQLSGDEPAWKSGLSDWVPLRSIVGVVAPSPPVSASHARIHLLLRDDLEVSHTLDEINAKLRSGQLSGDEPAWKPGLSDWVPVSEMEGVKTPLPPPFRGLQTLTRGPSSSSLMSSTRTENAPGQTSGPHSRGSTDRSDAATADNFRAFLRKLVRGEFGLFRTYWGYFFIVHLFANIVAGLLIEVLPPLAALVALVYLPYISIVLVGVWRASEAYEGFVLFRALAKLAVILGSIHLVLSLLIVILSFAAGIREGP